MSLRRGGTPLGPTSAPPPTLEAANQSQITDLVQRNRTLTHSVQKLTDQLTAEQVRSASAITSIQHEHAIYTKQCQSQCAEVLRMGRIVTRMAEVETEVERAAVVREMGVAREEKLERLRRDHRIKLFQMREEELEREVEGLEEERKWEVGRLEREVERERALAEGLEKRLKEVKEGFRRRMEDVQEEVENAVRERENKETEYNALRKEHASLETKLQTLDTKFQRTRLQLEGAQSKLTELERANDDLKRTNANLANQVERWENLETKGGEAAEEYREWNRQLEEKIQEVREEMGEQKSRFEKELGKEKKRVENLKSTVISWEVEAKEEKNINVDLKKQLAKLHKMNEKLKAEGTKQKEQVTRRMRPPNSPGEEEDEEVAEEVYQLQDNPPEDLDDNQSPAEPEPTKKPPSKKPELSTKPEPSSFKVDNSAKPKSMHQIARKSTGGKPPPPYPAAAGKAKAKKASLPEIVEISDHDGDVEEIEESAAPTEKRKGKAKAAEPPQEAEETEEVEPPKKQKGKRKASDEDVEDVEIVATKKGRRAVSELREKDSTAMKPKGKSRAGSIQPRSVRPGLDDQDEAEDGEKVKKKKRKIIPSVTSGPAAGPFAFGSLNLGKVDDLLNIPSMLSPLKPDEQVPRRSTSAALHGLSKLRR